MVKSHFVTCRQKYPWHGAIGWRGVVGLRLWVFDSKFNVLPKTAYFLQSEMTRYFEKGSSPFPNWHTQYGNVPWHTCLPQRVRCIYRIEIWKRSQAVSLTRRRIFLWKFFLFYFWIFWRLARGVILGRVLCCWMSLFFFFFLKKFKLYMVISHVANLLFEFKFLNITIWLFFFFCDFFSNIYIYIYLLWFEIKVWVDYFYFYFYFYFFIF